MFGNKDFAQPKIIKKQIMTRVFSNKYGKHFSNGHCTDCNIDGTWDAAQASECTQITEEWTQTGTGLCSVPASCKDWTDNSIR